MWKIMNEWYVVGGGSKSLHFVFTMMGKLKWKLDNWWCLVKCGLTKEFNSFKLNDVNQTPLYCPKFLISKSMTHISHTFRLYVVSMFSVMMVQKNMWMWHYFVLISKAKKQTFFEFDLFFVKPVESNWNMATFDSTTISATDKEDHTHISKVEKLKTYTTTSHNAKTQVKFIKLAQNYNANVTTTHIVSSFLHIVVSLFC